MFSHSLLASLVPKSSAVALFPVIFVRLEFDDLSRPLSWWQPPAPPPQGSTLSFSLVCSLCEAAQNEDSEKASSGRCWTPSGREAWGRQCPSAKGYLPLGGHCVWPWCGCFEDETSSPVPSVVLSFLWDVKEHDGKAASEQLFIQNSDGRLFSKLRSRARNLGVKMV